MKTTKNVS